MKKMLALIVVALFGFYIVWPLWTGYSIRQAIETADAALLESKVDFASVRQALKPVVVAEANAYLERLTRDVGPLGGLIAGSIKGDVAVRLADSVISATVTPPNVIRMVRDGRDLKQLVERVLAEQTGGGAGGGLRPQGLGGKRTQAGGSDGPGQSKSDVPQPKPAGQATASKADMSGMAGDGGQSGVASQSGPSARRRLSLDNIKSFTMDGPLAFAVGIAKDAAASQPDITATLRFTGGGWKVVAVTPGL